MKRQGNGWFLCLMLVVLLAACSSSNSDAPSTGQAHPAGWLAVHPTDPSAQGAASDCALCHGIDFTGSGNAVSCFDCHSSGPPFTLHPGSWTTVVTDHQGFAATESWTSCATAVCHGNTLQGGNFGPSCLLPAFGSVACHPGGGLPAPAGHTANFTDPANHGPLAKSQQLYCRNCHGQPANQFDGGFIADASILNNPSGKCSGCHTAAKAHPTNWQGSNDTGTGSDAQDNAYASSHRGLNTVGCQLCHKTTAPGIGPMPAAPSCFDDSHLNANNITTGCHGASGPGAAHSVSPSWLLPSGSIATSHVLASIAGTPDCSACHAQSGGLVLPDCGSCHSAGLPNGVIGTCNSCHNAPPDGIGPAGNARPNRPGAHGTHDGLTTTTGTCTACHNGAGSDTTNHYDTTAPANVVLLGYNGKRGSATFTPAVGNPATGVCADVSCHGGQTTPDWLAGSLVVNQDCLLCHEQGTAAQSPENNSFYSGRHSTHAGVGGRADNLGYSPTCSACHDPTLITQHFTNLDTLAFEGNPAATLVAGLGYVNTVTPPTCATNIVGCHPTQTREWSVTATGSAPHTVGSTYTLAAEHGADAKGLNPTLFPNGLIDCQGCHGQPGGAGSNPRFNVGILSAGGNGCEGCHNDRTAHPSVSSIMAVPRESVDWFDVSYTHNNVPTARYTTACALCHGASLGGGIGPSCATGVCHVADPVVNNTGCISCHAQPPSGAGLAGNVRPNRAGAHTIHNALVGVTNVCSTCHNGVGYGTAAHFDFSAPANVAIPAVAGAYMPKSGGSPTFTPNGANPSTGTCSNVSCHGGKTTLDWLSGSLSTLTGNALCLSCHAAGTAQYNGYSSGRHNQNTSHTNFSLCTECHDPTKLTNAAGIHFNDLATTAMTEAKLTILLDPAPVGAPVGSYTPGATAGTGSCTVNCHSKNHTGFSW